MTGSLGAPFVLCTTQNQSRLQGIEAFDDECVLATFDKAVTKYKVRDQRPLSSWNLKEGFKCPAVLDSNNIVAVTKNNQIISWTEDASQIEKFKKSMIVTPILKLLSFGGKVQVVFQNGTILPVDDAIEKKKQKIPELFEGNPSNVFLAKKGLEHVFIFVSQESAEYWLVSKNELFGQGKLHRDNKQLRGLGFDSISGALISFWSDGELYSRDFMSGENGPGESLGKVEGLSGDNVTCVLPTGNNSIALCGSSKDNTSGRCLLFNTKYRIVQEERKVAAGNGQMKLFGPLSSHLFLSSGNQILALPIQLNQIQLDEILGKSSGQEDSELEVLDWDDSPTDSPEISYPESIEKTFEELYKRGLPESKISEMVVEPLMKKKDIASISFLLENMNKVSELILAKLVSFCLRGDDRDFCNDNTEREELSAALPPESPLLGGRKRLLNLVLSKSFTASKLLPEVRVHISPQDAILFIQHAASQLWDGDAPTEDTENQITQMVNWVSILLDAHYQYCLLTCDQQVTTVLNALLVVIDMQIGHTGELEKLRPVLELLMKQYNIVKPETGTKKFVFPQTDPKLFVQ